MTASAPKNLVLHYLPVRAKAEPLRMMLRHGGIAYVSHVFTWPEWAAAKEAHTFPFDRLPVMDVDGRQIAESGALARLIARWAGLYPADPVEAAAQEMVQQAANDLENAEPIFNGFTKEPATIEAFFTLFALRCGQLERVLGAKQFYGGEAVPSFADFTFFNHYDLATAVRPGAGTPALDAWAARMRAVPAVAAEIAERPPAGPSAA